MIKVPLNDIIAKIKEKSGLSEQEIMIRMEAKMKQLSGLISKEGAAHIVANELGIKLFDQISGRLEIKNILSGMRNVETVGRVQAVYEIRQFKTERGSGQVGSFMLGDETGTIRIVCWGDMASKLKELNKDIIVKIQSGYVRENNNRKEVHLNDKSRIIISPPGENVGSVKEVSSVRKKISELNEQDQNAEILGTIVQVFEPRFFEVCSDCNRRVKQEGGNFLCPEHGKTVPDYSYVVNCDLDDGTETIRCVFFRNQAERLLNKTPEEMIRYKDNPTFFESSKNDLLGTIIKLVGRVNKNDMFGRNDFVVNLVFQKPDPQDEIKMLQ